MDEIQYPRFTIIIPIKDREEYIGHTLKTCLIQDYPNFEVIVSDDCSEDNSVEVIKKIAQFDPRIRLFAHKQHLGMRDNFEFALNQVQQGYVMALGGDDGLTPGCIWRMYEILHKTGRQILAWTPAYFSYPDKGITNNIFYLTRKKSHEIKILKTSDFLNKISRTFNYQIDECPMFYMKGVVSMELVNKVRSRSVDNNFYHCPTPDGFSGVVLAGEVDDYAFTYEPLSIGGDSPKSQGKNYTRTDQKSKKESEQFFNDNLRRVMHHQLASQPYSPLQTLMTADYLLTARDISEHPERFEKISFENLLKVTFKVLEKHPMDNELLIRELMILREIASQHNLLPLFNKLMLSTRRRIVKEEPVYGFLITHSLRFDGSILNINNIYDAALATNFIYNFYKNVSFKAFMLFIENTFRLLFKTCKYKIQSLPKIE